MNYNLSNIHTAPSYDALKRMGFTDLDVVAYYGTPIPNRKVFINDVKAQNQIKSKSIYVPQPTPTIKSKSIYVPQPTPTIEKRGTQKCTGNVDIDTVRDMALEYMEKDWGYKGVTYNMKKMGWKFAFNDRKTALGLCSYRRRTVYLSTFFIENGSREMKMWKNTMIHEIAHAINRQLGGRQHDWQWRDIFVKNGGDGNRTNCDTEFDDLIANPVSKYTTVCPNGHTRPSHKKSRTIAEGRLACTKCCNELANGKFDSRFKLKQIQNY